MSINSEKLPPTDVWAEGDSYDRFMGRWSRLVAHEFITWLDLQRGIRWLDVGSGTGVLSRAILEMVMMPTEIKGVDSSDSLVSYARDHLKNERVFFKQGDALALPFETARYDVSVSALAMNFISEHERMIAEMVRVVRGDGTAALYVWDYASGMQMLRYFWNAAAEVDRAAEGADEGRRFPVCRPQTLERLFTAAALQNVQVRPIIVPTEFKDFDDFWTPFQGGQGPAGAYLATLDEDRQNAIRDLLRARLPTSIDGSIPLFARAWAVKGQKAM